MPTKKKAVKKKIEKVVKPTSWNFLIVDNLYTDDLKEYKSVRVNGKEVYKILQERIFGVLRNQTVEVLAALKKETGLDWTKDELNRAILIGILEKE